MLPDDSPCTGILTVDIISEFKKIEGPGCGAPQGSTDSNSDITGNFVNPLQQLKM